MNPARVLLRIDHGLVLLTAILCLVGVLFIHSATIDQPELEGQDQRQLLFLTVGAALGLGLLLVPYRRLQRGAWQIYGVGLVALALLPVFGVVINGARRWYRLPGFTLQPTEFVKLALIVMLASYLRFQERAHTWSGLHGALLLTAVPAGLILLQPDLGSSLVLWPIFFAVAYAAFVPARRLLLVFSVFAVLGLVASQFLLQGYQRIRIETWFQHFSWQPDMLDDPKIREAILGPGFQPWQSLIAIGAGGMTGFGLNEGPQNRYDFLPYRSSDYVFSVVCEETGWIGATTLLALQMLLASLIYGIAARSREPFARLCCVGVATWLSAQALMHAAVCAWMVPATGLPMPFLSAGGSSTLAALLGVALVLNISARREPELSGDGFR